MQQTFISTETAPSKANSNVRRQIVIRPNHSMSWQGNSSVFLSLLIVSAVIVGFFAWQGLWLIAPFSGLELIFLGLALYVAWRKTQNKEVIAVTDNEVIVCSGINRPERRHSFPRHWVQVVLSPAALPGHPSKLSLRAYGKQLEIGNCLSDIERQRLAKEIKRQIHT